MLPTTVVITVQLATFEEAGPSDFSQSKALAIVVLVEIGGLHA